MSRTSELRAQLRNEFIPHAISRGFENKGWVFRRVRSGRLEVFDIQWDKYNRPRFIVNFANCDAEGVVFAGSKVLPDDVHPSQCSRPGRLGPGDQRTTRGWFCQDRNFLARLVGFNKLIPAANVVRQLTEMFSELEEYWDSGHISKHIHV